MELVLQIGAVVYIVASCLLLILRNGLLTALGVRAVCVNAVDVPSQNLTYSCAKLVFCSFNDDGCKTRFVPVVQDLLAALHVYSRDTGSRIVCVSVNRTSVPEETVR